MIILSLLTQVWHAHMLRPGLYRAACAALLGPSGGDLIDHNPADADDDPAEKYERLRRTTVVYKILYGQDAPSKLWGWSFLPGEMPLFVKMLTGKKMQFHVDPRESLAYLKLRIQVNINTFSKYARFHLCNNSLNP